MTGACLVVGAGEGVGQAVAAAFAQTGLVACLTRRPRHLDALQRQADAIIDAGFQARAYGVDARDEAEMAGLVDRIESEVGPIEAAVFNIGANVMFPTLDTTTRVYTKVWEMAALAGFLTGREVARVMQPRGRGTILFTGATASLRGRAGFSAFAGAKHALRALAQSMAKELGPQGIHVAHIMIDGAIDGAFTRENASGYADRLRGDAILLPAEIAKNYVWLHQQHRSAWTHELDLRPWTEPW